MATKKTTAKPAAKRASVKTGVRRVALVGVNPAAKKKNNVLRYEVLARNIDTQWTLYAAFKNELHAKTFARDFHKGKPSMSVKVDDSQS